MTVLLVLHPGHRPAQAQTVFRSAEALVTEGKFAEAKRLLESNRFEGAEAVPAAYLLAVVYARTGQAGQAEKLLRDILSRDPDIDAVRLELVRILAAQGKKQGASYQLNRLTDTADLARDKDQLEQLARQIGSTDGFTLSGYLSLAPSTNVNDGTSQSVITIGGLPFLIAGSARQQSGVGVKAGAVAGYSRALGENLSAYTSLSGGFADYSNDQFDKQQTELRVGIRHHELTYSLQAEAIVDRHWQNAKASSLGIGGRLSGKWNFSRGWWLSAELTGMKRSFDADALASSRTLRTTVALRHAFSNRLAMSISGSFETEDVPARPWNSYDSPSVTFGVETALVHGVRMSASLSSGERSFRGLFPGVGMARHDTFWELRGTFRKDNLEIAGLSPVIGVFRKEQRSNVAFYEYSTTGMELTFTKAF